MARRGIRVVATGVAAGAWLAVAGIAMAADTDVEIAGFAYAPETVTIQVGDSVTWANGDATSHTATGSDFDTGAITAGSNASVTFDTPGTFAYVCRFHTSMAGTVVVEGASGGGGGGGGGGPTNPPTDTAPGMASGQEPAPGVVALLGLAGLGGLLVAGRRLARAPAR